ncbi:MAG: hypothetical protein KDD84_03820 [Caldilineaceae bacterium]|nr:hypothetical protein [Caldilineaceae bacterium]
MYPTPIDPNLAYTGPRAAFASITGSPLWGLTMDEVIDAARARGWTFHGGQRQPTPYGLGPLVNHFATPDGRDVLWIPSYGMVLGEDWDVRGNFDKLFWVLWQAGVKVLIIGGTSGIADWRRDDDAIHPGDIVLPWSFRTKTTQRGLPFTPHETFWPKHDLLLDEPFCRDGSAFLAEQFGRHVNAGTIRRVHTPVDARVALVMPDSLTFETDYDILMWLAINKMSSDLTPDQPPVATLHGDCINPILARSLGIHVLYYHMVSNYAQGLARGHEIADTIYDLYIRAFPQVALDVELTTLSTYPLPADDACRCVSSVHLAPEVFSKAMTQPTPEGSI